MLGKQGQPRCVIAHWGPEVRAVRALAGAVDVWFLSAPGVAGYLGPAGFRAVLEAGDALDLGILDASHAPGHALAALRCGLRAVVLARTEPAFPAIAALFAAQGALLLPEAPPALDLAQVNLGKVQGRRHLARWLGRPGADDLA